MKTFNKKTALWGAVGALALSTTAIGVALAHDDDHENEPKIGVSAPDMTRAIEAAAKAKSGDIAEVEVESEGGKTMIEVEILAQDGKTYEVSVEAATGKVAAVEQENEDNDKNDNDDQE